MKIAITGCGHGELDKIYRTVDELERRYNFKVGLLLNCGDFQAVRNPADLECMAVPPKFRSMNTFYKYYSGECRAPILTIFIGGNHEASNYLSELPYGGWVAPNIYYLGLAGCIRFGKLRIAGISGIFNKHDYLKGHFEKPPYNNDTLRSVFHSRSLEVFRLKQLGDDVDIFMSHDWPSGIYDYGDKLALLRAKPFFDEDIKNRSLGAEPLLGLLDMLMPRYWFAAHLHVKFSALYRKSEKSVDSVSAGVERTTKFLALDKCLPRRQFIQIMDFETGLESDSLLSAENLAEKLRYDPQWLAILKSTDHLLNVTPKFVYMPGSIGHLDSELQEVDRLFDGDFRLSSDFIPTAPVYHPETYAKDSQSQNRPYLFINPQTSIFCEKLGIQNLNQILAVDRPICVGDEKFQKVLQEPLARSKFCLPPPCTSSNASDETFTFRIDTNSEEISDTDLFQIDTKPSRILSEFAYDHADASKLDAVKANKAEDDFVCEKLREVDQSSSLEQNVSSSEFKPTDKLKLPMKRRNADIYQYDDNFDNC